MDKYWKENEIEILEKYYCDFGPTYCLDKLNNLGSNRSYKAIMKKAKKLELNHDRSKFYKSQEFKDIVKS